LYFHNLGFDSGVGQRLIGYGYSACSFGSSSPSKCFKLFTISVVFCIKLGPLSLFIELLRLYFSSAIISCADLNYLWLLLLLDSFSELYESDLLPSDD